MSNQDLAFTLSLVTCGVLGSLLIIGRWQANYPNAHAFARRLAGCILLMIVLMLIIYF